MQPILPRGGRWSVNVSSVGVSGMTAGGCDADTRGYEDGVRDFVPPLLRQLSRDRLGLGPAAQSRATRELTARTATADRVVKSICPYCAVGCGQNVYVKDEQVVQIEGDPDSPISRGRLCPKGSASRSLVTSPLRETKVKYRRPFSSAWEDLDLDTAMDMIAERMLRTRAETWEEHNGDGEPLNRTLGMAVL